MDNNEGRGNRGMGWGRLCGRKGWGERQKTVIKQNKKIEKKDDHLNQGVS